MVPQTTLIHYSRRQFTRTTLLAGTGYVLLGQSTFAQESTTIYTVKKNDTLGHIALRYGVSVNAIKQANGLSKDLIYVGQKLRIPKNETQQYNAKSSEDFLVNVRKKNAEIAVKKDQWKRIIAHHSAIKYGNAAIYDRAHRQRGMQNGLAYHFVIGNGIDSGDGEIELGPRWLRQLPGGHVKNHEVNINSIGICLVGNFEATHPSRRQLAAFTQLVDWLQQDVLKKKTLFAGHKDMRGEQTVCPGRNFPLAAMHARYS